MHLQQDLQELFSVSSVISLLTLSVLEIVLGIDNIIFISIIAGKLPKDQQGKARTIGLMLALVMRIALLFSISFIVGLKTPLFTIMDFDVTGRDMILFSGGVFLLYKTTIEIHNKVQGYEEESMNVKKITLSSIVFQIVLIDIVFSFDSILTAVGLVTNLLIMIVAVIIAMIIMILFSGKVSNFINENPTIKILALSFLLLIAVVLILEAFHEHVDKKFIYISIAFSLFVESLNIRMRRKQEQKGSKPSNDERDII
ncbi:MAG TPA: TerC family protein [Bacteroidia bacterium]|jgi:predicted tellurium resistance membrane protein TerC|nr:TerC family protein [Bacteroidia bacterium]